MWQFAPGNSLYNSVANGLIGEYLGVVSTDRRLPNTAEIFQHHEDVFAREGIPGTWMGTAFPNFVARGIGGEPWDFRPPINFNNHPADMRPNSDGSETHTYTDPNTGAQVQTKVITNPVTGTKTGVYTTVIDPNSPMRGMTYLSHPGR
ncbi:MAG: hypothetical protein U5N55_13690 [Cypionkella sp.]|nr:hypothetical protein [Cypionkella sp.]